LPIYQTPDALTNFFTITGENTAAGCYALSATDTAGNESAMSQPFCFDNCPELELGNIFTPNNDGRNDFFTPIKLRSVKLLSFKIFDRWGALLFEQSEDIVHLWDGSTSNGPANDGVYYYVIEAELMKLKESEKVKKAGTVTLLR
jgi:gliding motility-associated-like protein